MYFDPLVPKFESVGAPSAGMSSEANSLYENTLKVVFKKSYDPLKHKRQREIITTTIKPFIEQLDVIVKTYGQKNLLLLEAKGKKPSPEVADYIKYRNSIEAHLNMGLRKMIPSPNDFNEQTQVRLNLFLNTFLQSASDIMEGKKNPFLETIINRRKINYPQLAQGMDLANTHFLSTVTKAQSATMHTYSSRRYHQVKEQEKKAFQNAAVLSLLSPNQRKELIRASMVQVNSVQNEGQKIALLQNIGDILLLTMSSTQSRLFLEGELAKAKSDKERSAINTLIKLFHNPKFFRKHRKTIFKYLTKPILEKQDMYTRNVTNPMQGVKAFWALGSIYTGFAGMVNGLNGILAAPEERGGFLKLSLAMLGASFKALGEANQSSDVLLEQVENLQKIFPKMDSREKEVIRNQLKQTFLEEGPFIRSVDASSNNVTYTPLFANQAMYDHLKKYPLKANASEKDLRTFTAKLPAELQGPFNLLLDAKGDNSDLIFQIAYLQEYLSVFKIRNYQVYQEHFEINSSIVTPAKNAKPSTSKSSTSKSSVPKKKPSAPSAAKEKARKKLLSYIQTELQSTLIKADNVFTSWTGGPAYRLKIRPLIEATQLELNNLTDFDVLKATALSKLNEAENEILANKDTVLFKATLNDAEENYVTTDLLQTIRSLKTTIQNTTA